MEALRLLSHREGIIPAIESAHAVAGAPRSGELGDGSIIVVNLSGRGDKDVDTAARWFGLFDTPPSGSRYAARLAEEQRGRSMTTTAPASRLRHVRRLPRRGSGRPDRLPARRLSVG